jgi:hypothetical protein
MTTWYEPKFSWRNSAIGMRHPSVPVGDEPCAEMPSSEITRVNRAVFQRFTEPAAPAIVRAVPAGAPFLVDANLQVSVKLRSLPGSVNMS